VWTQGLDGCRGEFFSDQHDGLGHRAPHGRYVQRMVSKRSKSSQTPALRRQAVKEVTGPAWGSTNHRHGCRAAMSRWAR
ncbi:hypothetical protein RZS08_29370, partial [Arthrospira platensis SPKY1]|nr:hypothetical protein [Arthrospira platensis SPKY1]